MSFVKTFLLKIGRLFLNIVRVLRKAICCRKKRQETEYLLPMTVGHVINMRNDENDLLSWDSWNESENSSSSLNSGGKSDDDRNKQEYRQQDSDPEDFFKDMVPQIRKPKKIYIKDSREEAEPSRSHSSRLAMDPKAILAGPDLGLIEDNPTNWEDSENLEEIWNSDEIIKEKRVVERERRLLEHQKRKLEKEIRRASTIMKTSLS